MRILARFFRRFLRHKRTLVLGFACIPLSQLGDVAITVVIGNALDRLRTGGDASFLRGVFAILMGLALARGLFRFLQRWWIVVVSRWFEVELKQDLFDKLATLSFSFHSRSRSGDVVSRVTSDVENLRMFLGPGMMYTAGALVMVPVSLSLLFSLEPRLTGVMIAPLVLMGVGMKLLVPRLHRHSTAVQEALGDVGHRAQENFSGIRVVKGYGRERQQIERFDEASRRTQREQIELARARGLSNALTHGTFDLTFVVILVLGGLSMIDGKLPVGDLFKFIDLTFKVFWPIIAMGWIAGMYPRALASGERVEALLGLEPEIADPPRPVALPAPRGELELAHVTFTYPGAERPALRDVSVHVRPGGSLGVVGPTGSGKTTLLWLFGRLYDVVPAALAAEEGGANGQVDGRADGHTDGHTHGHTDGHTDGHANGHPNGQARLSLVEARANAGEVRVDGHPVRTLALSDLRGALAYVPQDSFLFSETWRENVEFGASEPLSDEALARLAERAALSEEVAHFPLGFDTLLGERGVTLSGGQRQRTCIARALARDPRVLVLDDALSAVDTETETKLLASLRRTGSGRTVVVAAHRLSAVARCDEIVVLSPQGAIEDRGTHDELVAREGWYRRTWQRQQTAGELEEL